MLADLRRWVQELQAAQGDVQVARQAADEAGAANAEQLGATDEAADPEAWHRLDWLGCGARWLAQFGRAPLHPAACHALLCACKRAGCWFQASA